MKKSIDEAITLVEILEDTSKGEAMIHRRNLFAGPMRDQEMVDFWEEKLDKMGAPYILAVIEMAERDESGETSFGRGQAFFTPPGFSL